MTNRMSTRYMVFFGLLLLAIAVLYADIFQGLYGDWLHDENYSHGFLVPLIAAYFAWSQRETLEGLDIKPATSGLILIFFALLILLAGVAAQEYYTRRSSFIFLLAGLIAFFFGWRWLKALLLPVGFLFFMIPLPYVIYDAISFPLKLFVAKFSVDTLKLIGVVVLREGNIIMFPHTVLEVADACSGLRSIVSLLALGVTLAVLTQPKMSRKILLVALTIPIAVFTNMVRVVVTGYLAQHYGAAVAEGFFHDFAGMGVFLMAMLLLFISSGLLRKLWP